jgi:HEAT repeat protein
VECGLTLSLVCPFGSALLKHEVAYVLGQVQSAAAVDTLATVLEDEAENPMVRESDAERQSVCERE